MGNVVRFENVSKRFGDTLALSELSLDIPSGTILGIAGRNGAGKTTAIRILLGLAKPDSGTVTTFDGDTSKRIGYSPELPAPYDWMTAREYLELGAGLAGVPQTDRQQRIASLLDRTHLQDGTQRISTFTIAMRQQLAIAFAMTGAPELLILDEPTSALDPTDEHHVLEIISTFRDETTILFVSHIFRDVEQIADSIAILDNGRLIANSTIDELREQLKLPQRSELVLPSLEEIFAKLTGGEQ